MALSESTITLPDGAGSERVILDDVTGTKSEVVYLAKGSDGTLVDAATAAKQLPDNHNVTVSNQPSEFPLPAAQVSTLTPPAAITGFATAAKQDTLLAAVIAPQGAVVAGTRDLTDANTWYSVPSTVPTSDYVLIASIELSAGTIRFSYANASAPSATYGNIAPGHLAVKMKANTSLYYGSSTAGDDVNWTTIVQ